MSIVLAPVPMNVLMRWTCPGDVNCVVELRSERPLTVVEWDEICEIVALLRKPADRAEAKRMMKELLPAEVFGERPQSTATPEVVVSPTSKKILEVRGDQGEGNTDEAI